MIRLVLPGLLFVGYGLIASRFNATQDGLLFLWTAAAAVSFFVLLASLRGPLSVTLPFWIFLVDWYLAYYVQFFRLVLDQDAIREENVVVGSAMDPGTMIAAYGQATIALALATLVIVLLMRSRRPSPPTSTAYAPSGFRPLIVLAVSLLCGTTLAMALLNIGFINAALPLRTLGWIQYTHKYLLPTLLLATVQIGDESGRNRWLWLATGLLFLTALTEALFTTTRAAFAYVAIELFALFAIRERLGSRVLRPVLTGAILTVLLFPFLTALRHNRIEGQSLATALTRAGRAPPPEDQSIGARYVSPVLNRFTGIDVLLPILKTGQTVDPSSAIQSFIATFGGSQSEIGEFNTREIWGYAADDPIGIACSLLGWLYLAGGPLLELVGPSILIGLIAMAWWFVLRRRMRTRFILLSQLSAFVVSYFSEGNIDNTLPLVAMIGSCFVVEGAIRFVERQQKSPRGPVVLSTG